MESREENLSLYSEYNKSLRAWLVGFGFGVPALFIVNKVAQDKLIAADNVNLIIWLFLIGAASQILMAFINKIVCWCAYYVHKSGANHKNNLIRFCANLEDAFYLDVTLDLISLVTFCWSIVLIMHLFTNA